jgi:iron complex outermembrane recepter protein
MSQREVSAQDVYRSRLNQWAWRALGGAVATALVVAAPVLYAQQLSSPAPSDADAPAPAAAAAPAAAGANEALQEIVVTGTRTLGLEAAESPAPLQVLSADSLKNVAASPDLMSTLAAIVPSFQLQAFGYDMAGQTLMANLYGLSPNDVLVLVDGKRRHTTANLAVDTGSEYTGAASADLNFIPVDAIDHIEVLTEGAAAQYGSDAVAGVINIILKKNTSGGMADATTGGYFDGNFGGNGATGDAAVNWGFAPIDGSYLNITLEARNHGHSDHSAIDERVINPDPGYLATYPGSNMPDVFGYPYLNHIIGDAEQHLKLVTVNAGYDFNSDTEFYVFATYGHKEANSYENYRPPYKVCYPVYPETPANVADGNYGSCEPGATYPYAYGFNPQEQLIETDYQVTGGFKSVLAGWRWDLASAYGVDHGPQYTLDSANAGLVGLDTAAGQPAPPLQTFYDGLLQATQFTNTLDISRDFDVGMGGPLTVAFGGEFRRETYTVGAGTPESWEFGGAQSYPGFTPADAGIHSRTVGAEYIDFALKPVSSVYVDVAGRHENYSDFGGVTIGKVTARWDITPEFAIRGTAQNGFRAPTLAEEYYTTTAVGPVTAFVQLPPLSPGAKFLGVYGLQPEKSVNFSAGFVYRPMPRLIMTLDLYQIMITNRITNSLSILGTSFGVPIAPEVTEAIALNGNQLDPNVVAHGETGIELFTNGIDTITQGIDFALNFPTSYPFGNLNYSIGANYNASHYTRVRPAPASFAGQPLFDLTALSSVTNIQPLYKINLGVVYSIGPFTANLTEILYGRQQQWQSDDGDNGFGGPISNCSSGVPSLAVCPGLPEYYVNNTSDLTPITNLALSWTVREHLTLTVGANNLLNKFPPGVNPIELSHENNFFYGDNAGVDGQMLFVPYGINGGFYFAKAVLRY